MGVLPVGPKTLANLSVLSFIIATPFITMSPIALSSPGSVPEVSLFDLPLDQLLTISVASKRPEELSKAPGIVAVISAETIRKRGYTNLRDILDQQTHLQIVGTNLFPHNKSTIRGVNPTLSDSTVLLQINGRPIRETTVSSLNHDIYNFFPVSAIEKIEIVRGPGSVLYGTNAMSGVINIVTAQGQEGWEHEASVTAGTFGTQKIEAKTAGSWSEVSVMAALYAYHSDGDQVPDITDQFGQQGTYPMGRQGAQAVFNLSHKNLDINALYSNTTTDNVRSLFAFPATDHHMDRYFLDVGYQHPIGERWHIEANLTYNEQAVIVTNLPEPAEPDPGNSEMVLAELMMQGAFSENVNFLAGVSHEKIRGGGTLVFKSESQRLYSQLDFTAFSGVTLVLGGQYNIPDTASGHLSPRLGAIFQWNDRWGGKLLYS